MKHLVAVLACALCGCGLTEPEDSVWTVRGTVVADGRPLEGARVVVRSLPNLLGPGPSGAASSGPDGRFEVDVRGPSCGSMYVVATRTGYVEGDVSGFSTDRCPQTLDGVRISMVANAPVVIQTTSLPAAVPSLPYDEQLVADGGDYSYAWAIESGTLPDGLTLDPGGRVTGTPSASGEWVFTVAVVDGAGATATGELSITVFDAIVLLPTDLCSEQPDSAVVTFSSPELARTARSAAGVRDDELLTCALAATIGELDASGATVQGYRGFIDRLTGLQNLTGLTRLDLSWNAIERIDELGALTDLETLDLSLNGVADLAPLAGLAALDTLRLGNNAIEIASPLSGLTDLRVLDLSSNTVSDVASLVDLVGLTTLDLSWNGISTLPSWTGMGALTELNLGSNAISSTVGLEGLTALVQLDLRSNPLTDLGGLSGSESLRRLDVSASYRALQDLSPLSGLIGLEELDASVGAVLDVGALAGLTGLRRLDLSDNAIGDVGPLSGLTGLLELDLSQNAIGDVSPLSGMTELTLLSLQANAITDIAGLSGLERVVDLDLANNAVTDLSPLQGLTTLDLLWLWANPSLGNIEPQIANTGLGSGDVVSLAETVVPCEAVARLRAKGVTVAAPAACG